MPHEDTTPFATPKTTPSPSENTPPLAFSKTGKYPISALLGAMTIVIAVLTLVIGYINVLQFKVDVPKMTFVEREAPQKPKPITKMKPALVTAKASVPLSLTTPPALASNRPEETFRHILFGSKWTSKSGQPCALNGGNYVTYTQEQGQLIVSDGVTLSVPAKALVTITEPDDSTVILSHEQNTAPTLKELQSPDTPEMTGRLILTLRKLGENRIEERMVSHLIDPDFTMNGELKRPPEIQETIFRERCTDIP